MNKRSGKFFIKSLLVVLLIVAGWLTFSSLDQYQEPEEETAVNQTEIKEAGERFMANFPALAPGPDREAGVENDIWQTLSSRAQTEIDRQDLSRDLALFIGVQDIPEEEVQLGEPEVINDHQATLPVKLNYSGSPAHRDLHLVLEQGGWKIDRVTADSIETDFNTVGNLMMNNPGLKPGVWYLSYEKPGQVGLTTALEFNSDSKCLTEDRTETCQPAELLNGQRVKIKGVELDSELVLVKEMTMVE